MGIDLKSLKVNVPKANIEEYVFTIYGRPKAGKTSFFPKLLKHVYGDVSKGLLIGFEQGFNALEIVATAVDDWRDYLDLVDQLVEEKEELGFKMIGVDTIDKMYKSATAFVLKRESRKDGKKYLAINDIPWGKGHEHIENEISDSLDRLKASGYGLYLITHDTDKKFESRDGVSYDKTTTSLPTRIRNVILNMSDFICFIDIAKEKDENDKLVDKRYIYFRADGADLEAGSRFENVPNRIEYDIPEFMNTFEKAVLTVFDNNEKKVAKVKKQQAKEKEEEVKILAEKSKIKPNDELVNDIKAKLLSVTAEQQQAMKDILMEAGVTSLKDPDVVDTNVLLMVLKALGE